MPKISITVADGTAPFSVKATRPRFWWIKWWIPEFLNPRGKLTESNLCSIEGLAGRIVSGMDRDHGRQWLLWMGVDHDKVKAMTDEELSAISRDVQNWPRKEPDCCSECGHEY